MKIFYITLLYCAYFIPLMLTADGQNSSPDSSLYIGRLDDAVRVYRQFTGTESPLYNGVDYIAYQLPVTGNPFFNSDQWMDGSVLYHGIQYNQVPIRYDIMRGVVVIRSYDSTTQIILGEAALDWFKVAGHTFIRIAKDSGRGLLPSYYELLYSGPHEVLAHWSKSLQTTYSGVTAIRNFDLSTRYYIRAGKRFIQVGSKSAMWRIFADKKNQVKADFRKSRIRFRRDPGAAIVRICSFYDRINP